MTSISVKYAYSSLSLSRKKSLAQNVIWLVGINIYNQSFSKTFSLGFSIFFVWIFLIEKICEIVPPPFFNPKMHVTTWCAHDVLWIHATSLFIHKIESRERFSEGYLHVIEFKRLIYIDVINGRVRCLDCQISLGDRNVNNRKYSSF